MIDSDFREKVEREIRGGLGMGGSPLFGLSTMIAYHMGFADDKGNPLDSAKGKYLRPLLMMAICAGLGGDPDKAVPAAAGLELIHRTSLIFDDIQDAGKERNGQPTVCAVWGVNQAINVGLALSCHARLAVQRSIMRGIPPETMLKILSVLEKAVIDLCWGQYSDLSATETLNMTVEDYLRLVQGKTGALFGAACEVGALCQRRRLGIVPVARKLGLEMGTAFQIADDYLGIWGDEKVVGKTANDLTEKKRSLPVVLALQSYPEEMGRWLSRPVLTPSDADEIRVWMEDRGIRAKTVEKAIEWAARARDTLEELDLNSPWHQELDQLLDYVLERSK